MEHSAVGKSSLEQQIHESVDYTCIVRKTGALAMVEPGLMAGRQAGGRAGGQAGRQAGRQAIRQMKML